MCRTKCNGFLSIEAEFGGSLSFMQTEHAPCNSSTTVCPLVRGDNPRALASGLSRTGGQTVV